ncbi:MAG: putative holin-like toxin [Lachnospiraceae bacterium]|nr:putative holin-like toxin [Lachnospiraceae bacterium]
MSTFESIYLMLTFATFIIALLTYIDRNNKRK